MQPVSRRARCPETELPERHLPTACPASLDTCSLLRVRAVTGVARVGKVPWRVHSRALDSAEDCEAEETEASASQCPSETPAGESRDRERRLLALPPGSRN